MNLCLPRLERWLECLDAHTHTAIFKTGNQQGLIVQHMELCPMLCGSLDRREVWGSLGMCICMAASLHCDMKLSQHC